MFKMTETSVLLVVNGYESNPFYRESSRCDVWRAETCRAVKRGFPTYRCQIHEVVDLIPLAPLLLARRRGILVVGDTPTSPGKDFALATLSWLSLIRHPRLW